jgi:antitoxin component YwqK of YwqJK toxin-antitoxin module
MMIFNQNPNIAKIFLLLLVTVLSLSVEAGEPEVFYYAGNNRPALEAEAIKKVEVDRKSDKKIWIETYIKSNGGWEIVQREKIQAKTSDQHMISHYDGNLLTHKTKRSFTKNENSGYLFEDRRDGIVIRSGHSKNKVPLHLKGVITEYYKDGSKRSESLYDDNQLVWNHNWLRNGDKYLDTIFYSFDTWPEYLNGSTVLKTHLNNHIVSSKYYNEVLEGTVLLGFVIMENGDLDGVHLVNESFLDIGKVAVEGFQSLPGKWKPATLNNQAVRCFMTFPINFIHRVGMFDEVIISGNVLFYNYR